MPFNIPSGTSDADRKTIYDFFHIGKPEQSLWIRKVKAFFTFGWDTANLTDSYVKNQLIQDSGLRALVAETCAANPRWLTRVKGLTVTRAVFDALEKVEDIAMVKQLNQAAKADKVYQMTLRNPAKAEVGKVFQKSLRFELEQAVEAGDLKDVTRLSGLTTTIDATSAYIEAFVEALQVKPDKARKENQNIVQLLRLGQNFTIDYDQVISEVAGKTTEDVDKFCDGIYGQTTWDGLKCASEGKMLQALVPRLSDDKREAFVDKFRKDLVEYQKTDSKMTDDMIKAIINQLTTGPEEKTE